MTRRQIRNSLGQKGWVWLAFICSRLESFQVMRITLTKSTVSTVSLPLRNIALYVVYFIAIGLSRLTTEKIAAGMQVDANNPMVGLEGRASLLKNLSKALQDSPQYFGPSARPGGLIGNSPHVPF